MPIVSLRSGLVTDPRQLEPGPDPVRARGKLIVATGRLTNAASDSSGSRYEMCAIPSDALFDPSMAFDVTDWGFAGIRIGTRASIGALVNQTKATANIVQPVAFGDTKFENPVWQVLGFAADPERPISLFAHAAADAVGAGFLQFRIAYLYR